MRTLDHHADRRFARDGRLAPPDPARPKTRSCPSGAKLELLFTRTAKINGGLTEGPAVAPDGSIYFTDMPFGADPGMILRFDPATRKVTVFTANSGKANGLTCDAKGDLVACEGADYGGRRVSRWNIKTGKSQTIADSLSGQAIQRAQRFVHRHQGAHLLLRPALPGRRAARAGASGRLSHQHRRHGRRGHARRREAQRRGPVARRKDALRRRPQQRHRPDRSRPPRRPRSAR